MQALSVSNVAGVTKTADGYARVEEHGLAASSTLNCRSYNPTSFQHNFPNSKPVTMAEIFRQPPTPSGYHTSVYIVPRLKPNRSRVSAICHKHKKPPSRNMSKINVLTCKFPKFLLSSCARCCTIVKDFPRGLEASRMLTPNTSVSCCQKSCWNRHFVL
jgi:hypothetical protein